MYYHGVVNFTRIDTKQQPKGSKEQGVFYELTDYFQPINSETLNFLLSRQLSFVNKNTNK